MQRSDGRQVVLMLTASGLKSTYSDWRSQQIALTTPVPLTGITFVRCGGFRRLCYIVADWMSHLVVAWLFDVSFVILKLCHILEDVPQCCCIVHNSLRLLGFSFFCMVPDCLCPGPASLGQTRIKQTPLIVLNTQIDFILIPVIWNIDLFLLLCVLCLIPAFLRPCDILIPDRLCFVCYSFVDSTDATKYRFQGGKNCKCICNIYIYIYIY